MTTPYPTSQLPPVDVRAGSSTFQVHTDRRSVSRVHGTIVALHAVLTLLILVIMVVLVAAFGSSGDITWLALLPFVILLVNQVLQIGYYCYVWGTRVAIEVPMTLDETGIRFTTAQGLVALPWPAIESVTIRSRLLGRVLSVRPYAGVRVDSPGVSIGLPAKTWLRVLRHGVLLGSRGIREDLDQVAAVIVQASGGRVVRR